MLVRLVSFSHHLHLALHLHCQNMSALRCNKRWLSLSLDLQCGGVAFCCCMLISVHKLPRHEVCKGVRRAASSVRSSVCLPVIKLPLLWFVAFSDFSLRHYLPDSLLVCCSASCVNIPEFCLPVQRALKKERGIKYHHRSRAHLQFSSTDRHRHTRRRRHTHTETETESAGFLHPSQSVDRITSICVWTMRLSIWEGSSNLRLRGGAK